MFGGISHCLHNDLNIFDFKSKKWIKEEVKDTYKDDKNPKEKGAINLKTIFVDIQGKITHPNPETRFGHSMVKFKNSFILYGGEEKYDTERKRRQLYNDVYYYHIQTNSWEKVPGRGKVIYGRKYHTATMIGKQMLVHGGINPFNKVIDETVCFDTTTLVWSDVPSIDSSPGALAGHTFTLVLHEERKFHPNSVSLDNLPKLPEFLISKKVVKNEGVF